MAKQALKYDADPITVPQCDDDAEYSIRQIGELQRKRDALEAWQTDAILEIKKCFSEEINPIDKELKKLCKNMSIYAAANRAKLTNDGKIKTVKFSAGEIRWRITPFKVSVKNKETVLKLLQSLKLKKFIRLKSEINKEALAADPAKSREILDAKGVVGITISQKEEFVIVPFKSNIEETVS